MHDSVEQLRMRRTPELTAAAVGSLQGHPSDVKIPTMEHDGKTYLDLRGIRIEQTQLDAAVIRNANLRWSSIRDVGFKGAQLIGCNLSQAGFAECYNHAFSAEHESVGERVDAVRAWLVSLLLNWMWGYGEKPHRITLAMAAGIFFFGALQCSLDGIPGSGFWAHVYFSGITFLTIGYGDLVPVEPLPRFLALVEGVVGITVLGMLIASWTKKIMYR